MTIPLRKLPFDRPGPLEPPTEYQELRRDEPVARVITQDGQPAWLVTSYAGVRAVLSDPRIGVQPPGADASGNDSLFRDGPAHQRLRRLVGQAFSPRLVAGLRPRIEELAATVVAGLAAAGPGSDLVALVAKPLPLVVISELLGVPAADRERFGALVHAATAVDFSSADPEIGASAAQAWGELFAFVGDLVEAKRMAPGDDLINKLTAVRDTDDGRLTENELRTMVIALVAGGFLTTTNAISIGVIKIVQASGFGALPTDGAGMSHVVEEVLRQQSGPNGEIPPRWAHTDLELEGQRIAAGDMLVARLEAANRDPEQFPDPAEFHPDRGTKLHVAFGHGPHHCLGAALARLELSAVFAALAGELPRLALASVFDDIRWTGHPLDDGPAVLPVNW